MQEKERVGFTSFPNWLLFIYFSCLISLTKVSSTVLNRHGRSRYVFPQFRKEMSHLSTLSKMIALGSVDTLYQFVEYLSWKITGFYQIFFLCLWNSCVIFVLYSVSMVYCICWFSNVKPTLNSWDKTTKLWCVVVLSKLRIQLAN